MAGPSAEDPTRTSEGSDNPTARRLDALGLDPWWSNVRARDSHGTHTTQPLLERLLAAVIAHRYYIDQRSKTEIAEEFRLSRLKITHVLDEAVATGLVRIKIRIPFGIDAVLSTQLQVALGLDSAIVVTPSGGDESSLEEQLGQVAAALLAEVVVKGDIVGLSPGRALYAMSTSLTRLSRCTVVQLTGTEPSLGCANGVEAVRGVARTANGAAYVINVPRLGGTADTAVSLQQQPEVAETMRLHNQVTKAVVEIGSWNPPNSVVPEALSEVERGAFLGVGVCADVCGILISKEGEEAATDLSARTIGISPRQLRRIPTVIGVASWPTSAAAIRAALRARFITSLVTDANVAGSLLERDDVTVLSPASEVGTLIHGIETDNAANG
jgi:DNA-binding transcriptional regulator LsrR (DeoR family)